MGNWIPDWIPVDPEQVCLHWQRNNRKLKKKTYDLGYGGSQGPEAGRTDLHSQATLREPVSEQTNEIVPQLKADKTEKSSTTITKPEEKDWRNKKGKEQREGGGEGETLKIWGEEKRPLKIS